MKASSFQRRQVSALVFLLLVALAIFIFLFGPFMSRFETRGQIRQLEKLVDGQKSIIARSSGAQLELDALKQDAALQERMLQGRSLNMAIAQAQRKLTTLVEENGGKINRVANANSGSEERFREIVTSVHFESSDQNLNDIFHAIEFGHVNFIIDRAEIRMRRSGSRARAAGKTNKNTADTLVVRIDVRGFWQKGSETD